MEPKEDRKKSYINCSDKTSENTPDLVYDIKNNDEFIELDIDKELIYRSSIKFVRDEFGEYMIIPKDQSTIIERTNNGRPKYFKNHPSFAYVDREKNKDIDLYTITYCSGKNLWFKCLICGYEYQASPMKLRDYNATDNGKPHCNHCRGYTKCQPHENCQICFNNSYAANPFSKYCLVDPKLYKATHSMSSLPHKCQDCGHNFNITPHDVSRGRGCPYCTSKKRCPSKDGCKWCYEHSAASNSFAYQLADPSIDLYDIYPNDPKKPIKWKCVYCGNIFENTCNRRMKNPNGGCNKCTYKGEKMMSDFLTENKIEYITQKKYPWCLSNKGNSLIFDFVIESYKLVIEVDGDQHFKDVLNWNSSVEVQHDKDIYKMRCLYKNGYSIIRVLQTDIFYNKISLKGDLLSVIKKYDQPTMVLIGEKDNLLYSSYKGYTYGDRVHKLV